MRRILVVAAHPDDEVLGCGGTIAAHSRLGDAVRVAILTRGLASRGKVRASEFKALQASARAANARLGVSDLEFGAFPDNAMDSLPRLSVIKHVEAVVASFRPQVVYTHHCGDLNVDHRRVGEAVVAACRPLPGSCVERIQFFEVPSSTEWQIGAPHGRFEPNWFVDVSRTLEAKLAALAEYQGEMREWPHARSIEAVGHLARWRGASVGLQAAEAFMLGRLIDHSS